MEFRTPMPYAVRPMNIRYGKIALVRATVVLNLILSSKNPGAIAKTIGLANKKPMIVSAVNTTSIRFNNILASFQKDSFPFWLSSSTNTGTIAEFVAPSPIRSRNRLGILKATTKAWAYMPVPKNAANTISRANPKIRLTRVANPMIPADFAMDLLIDMRALLCYIIIS